MSNINAESEKTLQQRVFMLTMSGVFFAIIMGMSYFRIGYIVLPFIGAGIVIVHIPVMIGSVMFGWRMGLFTGFIFGLSSFMMSFITPDLLSPIFIQNPLLCFVPRIMVGLVAYWVFAAVSKVDKKGIVACSLAGGAGALTNTVLVLGGLFFFANDALAKAFGTSSYTLLAALGTIIITNGIAEVIAAMILLPLLVIPLKIVLKKMI